MRIRALIQKQVFCKGDFYILSAVPLKNPEGFQKSKYGTITLKGQLNYLNVGNEYDLEVELEKVDKYGVAYKVLSCPTLENMLVKELTPEEAYNIMCEITTKNQAKTLIDTYPDFVSLVLDGKTEEIDTKKLYNIGEKRLQAYIRDLNKKFRYYHLMTRLKSYDLTTEDCRKLFGEFENENECVNQIKSQPYRCLIDICGRSFPNTDKLLMRLNKNHRYSFDRIEYCLLYLLDRNEMDSCTKINANRLVQFVKEIDPELVPKLKEVAIESYKIYYDDETKDIARMDTYQAECNIAYRIKYLNENPYDYHLDYKKYQNTDRCNLTDEQIDFARIVSEKSIGMLNGFSGSGKSQSTYSVVKMLEDDYISYKLLAPTGIAAKVLSKSTGRKASTIHRYIAEMEGVKVSPDVVFIDEFSMVGVSLLNRLFNMLSKETKIFFICDLAQLPSISAGNVLYDITTNNAIPIANLTKIFRYGKGALTTVATDVRNGKQYLDNNGEIMFSCEDTKDYEFIEISDDPVEQLANKYKELIKNGYSYKDIIVLPAFNVGEYGTYNINNKIQDMINPLIDGQKEVKYKRNGVEIRFRIKDKVINIKNNYEAITDERFEYEKKVQEMISQDNCNDEVEVLDEPPYVTIVNGDIGYIRNIDNDGNIFVQFDENIIVFTKSEYNRLLLAYSISCHKSQGSESKVVITFIHPSHSKMLNRQLLYVADTRSKEKLIEIADPKTINQCLDIVETDNRETFLLNLLKSE